jgi:hypothetical protein
MAKNNIQPYLIRLFYSFLVALFFVGIISEGAHLLNKEKTDRPPKTIELVIPTGTAERITAGEEIETIPSGMVFVIGDTLRIINNDSENHELGPLYIPSGTSASLVMEDANKYTLGCTFQPSKYFDFDVRPRTTLISRLQALMLATPPTTMFFFIYSLLIYPIHIGDENQNGDD